VLEYRKRGCTRVLNLATPWPPHLFPNVTAYDSGATANYNGMIVSEKWQAASGVNVIANYTWSHCIGEANNGTTTPNPGSNYIHLNDRALDAGNCSQDRRNIFNLTIVGRTPTFSNKALKLVASGWTTSLIYRYQSGRAHAHRIRSRPVAARV